MIFHDLSELPVLHPESLDQTAARSADNTLIGAFDLSPQLTDLTVSRFMVLMPERLVLSQ